MNAIVFRADWQPLRTRASKTIYAPRKPDATVPSQLSKFADDSSGLTKGRENGVGVVDGIHGGRILCLDG